MADISIDEAKAKIWLDDVNAELEAVEGVLAKVTQSFTTPAGSGDSIMDGIYKVGTTMETTWNELCKGFKSAYNNIVESVKRLSEEAGKVIGDADTLKDRVRR